MLSQFFCRTVRLSQLRLASYQSNPYTLLGINSKCTPQEIKLAYYKLAQQYHPDKNPAKDAAKKFTELNQAYEILSDVSSRSMYDSCSTKQESDHFDDQFNEFTSTNNKKKREKRKPKTSRASSYDDYQAFFDEFDLFFQKKQGKKKAFYQKRKGDDITLEIEIDFRASIFGTTRIVLVEKTIQCVQCKGSRAEPNTDTQTCYSCGGSGSFSYASVGEYIEQKCEECNGWGQVVRSPCRSCKGEGVQSSKYNEEIQIPQAIEQGQLLRKQSCGHAVFYYSLMKSPSRGENGDLLIKVNVRDDKVYRKDGYNILSHMDLTISEAVLGTTKVISTIWGDVSVDIPPQSKPSCSVSIPQMGVQYGQSRWKRGDHVVVLKLNIPKSLDSETKQLFQQISKNLN